MPVTGRLNVRSSEAIGEVREICGKYVNDARIGSIVAVRVTDAGFANGFPAKSATAPAGGDSMSTYVPLRPVWVSRLPSVHVVPLPVSVAPARPTQVPLRVSMKWERSSPTTGSLNTMSTELITAEEFACRFPIVAVGAVVSAGLDGGCGTTGVPTVQEIAGSEVRVLLTASRMPESRPASESL